MREDKSVSMIEQAGIFSSACFYNKLISRENRDEWHNNALEALRDVELVFCDPDNGPIGTKSKGSKNSEKYISPLEIVDYYNRGQNVAYYCQKARRTWEQWDKTKNEMAFTEEYLGKNNPSSKSLGGKLELEMDSGVIANIIAQEDGWVTIQFSDQPGRSTRTRIDHFLNNYRR